MLNLAQKQEVSAQVKALIETANAELGANMDIPTIKYKLRGTTAGTALGDWELDFNAVLMEDNWEHFKTDTIIHEVAHLVDYNINGIQRSRSGNRIAHGDSWKQIMRKLGGNPTCTHDLDCSKVEKPKRKYIYTCDCCGKELTLTSIRHNRLVESPGRYRHCRGFRLTLKTALGKVSYAEAAQMKNTTATTATAKAKANAPVTAKKATVTVKKGTVITKAVAAFKKAQTANSAITRQEMITVLVEAFKLKNDKPGRIKAAGYYQSAKKQVEA